MGKRGRKRRSAENLNPLRSLLPSKRSEPSLLTMLRNVVPVLDPVTDDEGDIDRSDAVAALGDAVESTLAELRANLAELHRFDAVARLAFREVAHDPETYVEKEHDGLLSTVMLVMSVAAEFADVGPEDAPACTPERVETLHDLAGRALQLALLRDAFMRDDGGGFDAGRLALIREVNWGPPSWPEDQKSLLEDLFDGVGDRLLRSATGFGSTELFAVGEAMSQAGRYLTILGTIEPQPFALPRAALHDLAGIDPAGADRVLDWFSTPLGQPQVDDPLEAARTRRMKPVLVHEDDVCWATPDLLAWAVQLSFEEILKGGPDFNPYQRHRAAVVERRAVATLARVLRPDAVWTGGHYRGSHGDGEVDGLLLVDRVAVVVEAKGQMLTTRARRGDPTRLEHNLGEILGKGSEQIGRFMRTLRDDGRVHFHDLDVTVESSSIERTFGLIATLDELNSLAVASLELADLGVSIDRDALPTVLSLHGLEETCRLLDTPWSLLHYLHRRRETARRIEIVAPEELDVVMFHIRKNLFFDDEPQGTILEVGVETDPLDAWSYYRRGLRRTPARKPAQKVPVHLLRLLDGLDREHPSGWTHAALHLLDFGPTGRSNVNKMLREARTRLRADGVRHDVTIGTRSPSWRGMSIVLGGRGTPRLDERAHFLAHLNGLRHEATRWIGVGVEVDGPVMAPTSVVIAEPPFEPVVGSAQVAPSVTWDRSRRVMTKGSNRARSLAADG